MRFFQNDQQQERLTSKEADKIQSSTSEPNKEEYAVDLVGNITESLAAHFGKSAEKDETEQQNEEMSPKKQKSTFGSTEKFENDAVPE
jgi:hypothetical protein